MCVERAPHLLTSTCGCSDCHNTCVFSSVFGTAKATQEADNLIVIQRGKRYRYLDVKKNRFDGELGIVPYRFDKNSGRVRHCVTGCGRPGCS